MVKPSARRAPGRAVLIVALALFPLASTAAAGTHGDPTVPPSETPACWHAEIERGDERSGDLRETGDGAERGGCSSSGAGGAALPVLFAVLLMIARRRRDARAAIVAGGATLALTLLLGCARDGGEPGRAAPRTPLGGDSALVTLFTEVGAARGVPAELLATISYVETRLRFVGAYRAADGAHPGHSQGGAIGLLALGEGGARDVGHAAALAGLDEPMVHTDERASVEAAAALLAELGAHDLASARAALIAYGGGGSQGARYADEIAARMRRGWTGKDASGATVTLSAIEVAQASDDGFSTAVAGLGYPGAIWNPASSSNFAAGSRGAAQIDYIVIHTVQGSYNGCISWFKDPAAEVSSHYVVRSSDGQITQMVDDSDVAWHDSCFNANSVGIEHEGYVGDPDAWYTEAMYTESAKLTAWLAGAYDIPKDRQHIYGHGDAPDCSDHTDPGSGWDWAHYMDLVGSGGVPQLGAEPGAAEFPTTMRAGEEAVVFFELTNRSNVTWGLDETRLGTQEPQDRDSAFFVDGNWLSPSRATGADHSGYGPGAVGRFTFAIKAPQVTETTTFDEAFQLVQEGEAWFGPVVRMTITVEPADGDPGLADDPGSDGVVGDPGPVTSAGCRTGGDGGPARGAIVLLAAMTLAFRRRRGR